ncbi:MAG: hypothetical protein NVS4B2_11960 [Chloroflexota bacterium]
MQRIGAGFQTWATVRICHDRSPQHVAARSGATATPVPTATHTAKAPVTMLVTYYLGTGSRMAGGKLPYVGAAACGYDLPLGARIHVSGVGTLTCEDRIGFQPWLHIDVFGVPLHSGYRAVTLL